MKTRARPESEGNARSRLLKASSPPAEAPMAAIGNVARETISLEESFSSGRFVAGTTFARAADFFLAVGMGATGTIHCSLGYRRSILVHEHMEVKTGCQMGGTYLRTESREGGRPGQLIGRILLAGPGPLAASRFAGGRSG